MKKIALAAAALIVFSIIAAPRPVEAGSRGTRGSFSFTIPGIAITTGGYGGVSLYVSGGGPGYSFGGRYGPRRGYPGHRPHRYGPRRGYPRYGRPGYGPGYRLDPFIPFTRHETRWRRDYFDRHGPHDRKWTSRTWIPGRMTSRGFAPGYWEEKPLSP